MTDNRVKPSSVAQVMIEKIETSAMKGVFLSLLQDMIDMGADHDGTAKEVLDHFSRLGEI